MSLRVESTSVEKCEAGGIVDFIFSKNAKHVKYDDMCRVEKS